MNRLVRVKEGAPPRRVHTPSPSLEQATLALAAPLYRLAARLLGNAADAEDVLQDAYAKALGALRTGAFRGTSELSTWLYRIVTNAALDRIRQSRNHRREAPSLKEGESGHALAAPEAAVALRELGEALENLPEDQRAALVLKELQGLSTREVAQVLERTEGATEQLLVRARQTLRRRFEP